MPKQEKGKGGFPLALNGGSLKTYLTIKELSVYLKISIPTIYKWLARKEIPHYRIKNLVRFDIEKIDAYMGRHEVIGGSNDYFKTTG